jgi:peptide/nickel transport system substrate-binding protein
MFKMDDRTLRLQLKRPDSTIGEELAQYYNAIVPVGYKRFPSEQVGTGPYKLDSFSPGEQSVHVRNPNYWRSGQPFFDRVTIIDFRGSGGPGQSFVGGPGRCDNRCRLRVCGNDQGTFRPLGS